MSRFASIFRLSLMKSFVVAIVITKVLLVVVAEVASETGSLPQGRFRYYFENSIDPDHGCQAIVYMGVGTAMTVEDYGDIATGTVSGQGIVVVVADHHPGVVVKFVSSQYLGLANEILGQSKLGSLIPVCNEKNPLRIIGGHSSSGQASMNALGSSNLLFSVDGFLGLDPWSVATSFFLPFLGVEKNLTVPALFWGLDKSTCGVDGPKAAAKYGFFNKVNVGVNRVLYTIDNTFKGGEKLCHCIFADKSCANFTVGVEIDPCPSDPQFLALRTITIPQSIHRFVAAIRNTLPFELGRFVDVPVLRPAYRLLVYVNDQGPQSMYANATSAAHVSVEMEGLVAEEALLAV